MKGFQISSKELEGRFDPKFYDPIRLQCLKKLRILSKKSGFDLYELKDLVDFKISAFYESIAQKYTDNGIPFIKVMDVKKLRIGMLNLTYLPKNFKNKKGKIARLRAGDVVISKGGTVGNVAIIPNSINECLMSRDLIGVTTKGKVNLTYIASFLSSSLGQDQLQPTRTQQNQAHLTLEPLRKVKILVPKNIHKEVSEILKKTDSLESEAIKLIRHAVQIFYDSIDSNIKSSPTKVTFQISSKDLEDTFSPSYYNPFYLATIKKMKQKSDTVTLGSFSDIQKGNEPLSNNYKKYSQKNMTDIPFIRTSDIINYEIDNYPDFVVSKELFTKYQQDIEIGDILFTNDGKIGLSAVVLGEDEHRFFIQSHIRRIRILKNKHGLSSYYIFAFLNTAFALHQVYRRILIQATISTIGDGLESIWVPILPRDKIQLIEESMKEAIVKMNLKKALINRAIETTENIS